MITRERFLSLRKCLILMTWLVMLALAGILSGCSLYRVKPLRAVRRENAAYVAEKNGVSIYAEPLPAKELKIVFNGVLIPKKYGKPFLVTCANNGNRTVRISADLTRTISADVLRERLMLYSRPSIVPIFAIPCATYVGYVIGAFAATQLAFLVESLFLVALPLCSVGVIPYSLGAGAYYYTKRKQFFVDFDMDLHNKIFSKVLMDVGDRVTKFMIVDSVNAPLVFELQTMTNGFWSNKTLLVASPVA